MVIERFGAGERVRLADPAAVGQQSCGAGRDVRAVDVGHAAVAVGPAQAAVHGEGGLAGEEVLRADGRPDRAHHRRRAHRRSAAPRGPRGRPHRLDGRRRLDPRDGGRRPERPPDPFHPRRLPPARHLMTRAIFGQPVSMISRYT
ncbi:hypothetical protein C1I98_15035 [Spongiactinospora gelatinilytica]|uniref:Uncharacterized protein n=1 Tax=Spongiactinospora gelatinilytica TaxID=2666298 RepID=A0A2W2GTV5_9ACTN|nr:hypothetical protein C1I98_15035 [Spongiactinospora gelatinilytica]